MSIDLDGTHVDKLDLETDEHPVQPTTDPPGATQYRKAIVAVVGAVVAIAAILGTDIDPEVTQSVIALATALLVYMVPNSPPVEFDPQDREQVGIE